MQEVSIQMAKAVVQEVQVQSVAICVSLPQEEYLTSCYWRTSPQPVDTTDKCDMSRPYYELYKVDFEQFRTLFLALVPQATGPRAPTLALRAFRVSCLRFSGLGEGGWGLSVLSG